MSDTLRAIMLMVAGMFFFTIGDAFVKLAGERMPVGMVMTVAGLGVGILFWVMAWQRGDRMLHPDALQSSVIMRCVGEGVGAIGIITALAFAPLSIVSVIIQSLPLLLTLMGVFFLGERVGYRRVSAMAAGFVGVLIIIRPGMDGFNVYTVFALIGVIGMAIRDFATRIAPRSISTAVLSLYGSLSVALAGALIMAQSGDWVWPDRLALLYCAGLAVAAALGTYVVVSSLRLADISSVSPYRFTRVIFGVTFGALIFGETMDTLTIIGTLIVVGAALYTWFRERALQQQAHNAAC